MSRLHADDVAKRLAIIPVVLLALVAATAATSPIVVSAYHMPSGILFDPPGELSWESWIPGDLRPAALAADAARREDLFRQRSDYGTTEVPFPLPLPPDLQRRSFYLLDSTGASELHPSGLLGTARIRWTDAGQVEAVQAFGQVQAQAGGRGDGGFVLVSNGPMTLVVEPSQLTADALLAPHGGTYAHQGTAFWRIAAQYRIRPAAPSAETWVWVQWEADTALIEAGCTLRFSLFRLTPEPVRQASTDTGCDV